MKVGGRLNLSIVSLITEPRAIGLALLGGNGRGREGMELNRREWEGVGGNGTEFERMKDIVRKGFLGKVR